MKGNKSRFIDCHTHLYNLYDNEGRDCFSFYDGIQKSSGAESINICAILAGVNEGHFYDPRGNILAALYKIHNPTAYAYGGLAYPQLPIQGVVETMDTLTQYNEMMEIGFDGIKMLEPRTSSILLLGKQINDGYFDGFFRQAEEDGTHIICHVASPHHLWNAENEQSLDESHHYWKPPYPSLEEIYGNVYEVLEKYPRLNISFAHFFFMAEKTDELEKLFEKYENVGVDLTPGTEMYPVFDKNPEFFRSFLEKHADRIMHGTDVSFPTPLVDYMHVLAKSVYNVVATDGHGYDIWGYMASGLNLSNDACDKILYQNFLDKHTAPKKVNVAALKRYADKYKHLIFDDAEKEEIFALIDKALRGEVI